MTREAEPQGTSWEMTQAMPKWLELGTVPRSS